MKTAGRLGRDFFLRGLLPAWAAKFYFLYIRRAARRFRPLSGSTVVAALSYRCQCSCGNCAAGSPAKTAGPELEPREIFALTEEIAALGAAELHIFGGEPLLVPWFCECVSRARRAGLRVTADTNGLLLDEDMVIRLKNSGLDFLGVSIDSPNRREHDGLRGIPGIFDKAVNGLRLCLSHGLDCCVSTAASRKNLSNGNLAGVISLARSLGTKTRIMSPVRTWGGDALEPQHIAALRKLLEPGKVFWETRLSSRPDSPFLCGALFQNHFSVSPSGDVQACCYWPRSFGNIRNEPLAGIVARMWKSRPLGPPRETQDCPLNEIQESGL